MVGLRGVGASDVRSFPVSPSTRNRGAGRRRVRWGEGMRGSFTLTGLQRIMAVVVAVKDGKGKTGLQGRRRGLHNGAGRHGTTRQRSSLAYAWTTVEVYMD